MNHLIDGNELIHKHRVFECVAGSRAYGTNLPESDVDTRGIFIAPPTDVLSFSPNMQVASKESDTVYYELRRFFLLAQHCNPNILEILWADDSDILFIDDAFRAVRDKRHLFLSKAVKTSFSAYAMAQLKRIKGHKKWIMRPQSEEPPQIVDWCRLITNTGDVCTNTADIQSISKTCFLAKTFGATQFRIYFSLRFSQDKLGFFTSDNQVRSVNVSDEVLRECATYMGTLFVDLDGFKAAHKTWRQYWDWKKNRNPKRAELEEKFQIDVKHAMHLVRLMRMAEEILTTGEVRVKRPDAAELLNIRQGKADYDELVKWAEETDAKLNDICKTSSLPDSTNAQALQELLTQVILGYWKRAGLT